MSPTTSLSIMFWLFFIWWLVGMSSGLLTKRETYSVQVVVDTLGLLQNVLYLLFGQMINRFTAFIFIPAWAYWLRRDWQRWKDSDDDDDKKRRRMEWVKNHLPKPKVKSAPVPE